MAGIGGRRREVQQPLYLALAFLLDSEVGELGFLGREPNSWKGGESGEDGEKSNTNIKAMIEDKPGSLQSPGCHSNIPHHWLSKDIYLFLKVVQIKEA